MKNRGPVTLVAFVAIVVLALAILAWWIYFNVREERSASQRVATEAQQTVEIAVELLNGRGGEVDPGAVLDQYFPYLEYEPTSGVPGPRDVTASPISTAEIRPDLHRLAEASTRSSGIVRMFLLEGAVFIVVQLVGVGIVYGALRREARLKRQQENFISAVTHELKSPLTAIDLFIQALGHPDLPPERRDGVLAKMRTDTRRLANLIDNLLDAGRALSGRFSPEPERVELGQRARELVASLQGYLEDSRAQVDLDESAGPSVRADPRYLESIFRNLVQNAVKYATDVPILHIRAETREGSGVLVIADEGAGLEGADVERVFEKFYRVGDEMVRSTPGSGLGLFLAREMARAMGGDLTAESEGRGRGTTFRLRLPLVEDAA